MQRPDKKNYNEEVAKLLPYSISEIKVQKKNKLRFSVFIKGRFLVGVSDSTLTKFNLGKDSLLTPSLFEDILKRENTWAIKEYCIRLLGRRDHARNELRDKARRKGFPSEPIEEVLDELTEKKYINNASFATKFAHDKFKFNKWGANKIRSELSKKGLSEQEIHEALSQIETSDQIEVIKNLILKNRFKFQRTPPLKRKKKIFDFLLRKGYDSNTILKQMPMLLGSVG